MAWALFHFPLQQLQPEARPAHQKSEAEKRHPTDQQHVQHARIHRSAAADHRLRMLRAEEPDRKINQRNIERAENRQSRRHDLRLRAVRETPQHQVAHINQPQHQRRSQPNISRRPPDSPHRTRPDRSRSPARSCKTRRRLRRPSPPAYRADFCPGNQPPIRK